MENNNHILTPLQEGIKFTKYDCPTTKEECLLMRVVPCSQLVGSLIHIIIHTKHNCSYLVSCPISE